MKSLKQILNEGKFWTPERLELLAGLHGQGKSHKEILRHPEFKHLEPNQLSGLIVRKRQSLGLNYRQKKWNTPATIEKYIQLDQDGHGPSAKATHFGVSKLTIRNIASKLRKSGIHDTKSTMDPGDPGSVSDKQKKDEVKRQHDELEAKGMSHQAISQKLRMGSRRLTDVRHMWVKQGKRDGIQSENMPQEHIDHAKKLVKDRVGSRLVTRELNDKFGSSYTVGRIAGLIHRGKFK